MPQASSKAIRQSALDLLTRREHSRQELSIKLQKQDYDVVEIDEALAALANAEIQSDQRFAEAYTYNRTQKGFGPLRIQVELRQRGIAEEIIAAALDKSSRFWFTQAKKINHKKFGAVPPLDLKMRLRQMRFLQTRGFSAEQIKYALSSARKSTVLIDLLEI